MFFPTSTSGKFFIPLAVRMGISLLFLAGIVPGVLSRTHAVNRTIDDKYGDSATGALPTYTPQASWSTDACAGSHCNWAPTNDRAYNKTYMVSFSSDANFTLQFTGTEIYVYTITFNASMTGFQGSSHTLVYAQLDGQDEESAITFDQPSQPAYNVLLYSKNGLSNLAHTLNIRPRTTEYLFFDYAIYTTEEEDDHTTGLPAATGNKRNLVGPIVGGVLGGLILLLGVFGFFLYRRRRRQRAVPPVFASGLDDIGDKPPTPLPLPLPSRSAPTSDSSEIRTPQSRSLMAAVPNSESRLGLRNQPGELIASEEKQALRAARQQEAARHVVTLQQEIRDLTQEAEARGLPSESTNPSALSPLEEATNANAQLMAEIRVLREQMNAIQQQQMHLQATVGSNPPAEGLPGYTAGPA
ncbi:hypothetical protein C8R43DRAFT_1002476 [Mycena crocata]|nr:hypothetical protein C8R43DRAFT_1002476 [Mycena crocata]